jgi:isochorismate hydrolase
LERFDLRRSALLVLDMQMYFLHPDSHAYIPSAEALLPGLQVLVGVYAGRGLPVLFTRYINTAQDAGNMATWWRSLLTATDPLSVITPALPLTAGETLIKTQYDAFYGTDLQARLQARRVTQVVVCGVMTHLCCETTARSAFMRGLEVFFAIDGTATYTAAHHRATLLNLAHGFATPVLVAELLAACQKADHADA